jgi:hypothetical protein
MIDPNDPLLKRWYVRAAWFVFRHAALLALGIPLALLGALSVGLVKALGILRKRQDAKDAWSCKDFT